MRTAGSGSFDVARYTAPKCATSLHDRPLQLELIEARRIQSAAYLHGSADELDTGLRGEPLPTALRGQTSRRSKSRTYRRRTSIRPRTASACSRALTAPSTYESRAAPRCVTSGATSPRTTLGSPLPSPNSTSTSAQHARYRTTLATTGRPTRTSERDLLVPVARRPTMQRRRDSADPRHSSQRRPHRVPTRDRHQRALASRRVGELRLRPRPPHRPTASRRHCSPGTSARSSRRTPTQHPRRRARPADLACGRVGRHALADPCVKDKARAASRGGLRDPHPALPLASFHRADRTHITVERRSPTRPRRGVSPGDTAAACGPTSRTT